MSTQWIQPEIPDWDYDNPDFTPYEEEEEEEEEVDE